MNRKMLAFNIADDLRELIRTGKLPVGAPVLSAKQLAEKYAVSPQTANKAMVMLMEESLLRRVRGSGTFVADNASAIHSKRFGTGFVIPQFDPFSVRVAFETWRDCSTEYLRKLGHQTVPVQFESLIESAQARAALENLDGLILPYSVSHDIRVIRNIVALGIPTVVIMHDIVFPHPYNQVVPDIFHGFLQMAQLLLKRGRERIVVASYGKESVTMTSREQTLILAALAAGFRRENITGVYGCLSAGDSGRLCGRDIYPHLPKGRADTAVVALSDFIGFGIIDELRREGLTPGKDMALLSYDDLEGDGLCPFGEPVMTSLRIPRQRIAERAAELLIARSEYRGEPEYLAVSVPVRLILRQSFR